MMPPEPSDAEWSFPNTATPLGSPAYYAVRFSPPELRQRYALLFAWRDQVVDIGASAHDPGVARLKLDWWRGELDALFDGRARHPLAAALARAGLGSASRVPMHRLLDASEQFLLRDGVADDDAFRASCRAEGGTFFETLASAGTPGSFDPALCRAFGGYCDAVERLRLAATQPARVPRDLLESIRANPGSAVIRDRCEALLAIAEPAATVDALPAVCRRLLATRRRLHAKLRRKRYPVADTLIDRPPIAHLWTAWRCR